MNLNLSRRSMLFVSDHSFFIWLFHLPLSIIIHFCFSSVQFPSCHILHITHPFHLFRGRHRRWVGHDVTGLNHDVIIMHSVLKKTGLISIVENLILHRTTKKIKLRDTGFQIEKQYQRTITVYTNGIANKGLTARHDNKPANIVLQS